MARDTSLSGESGRGQPSHPRPEAQEKQSHWSCESSQRGTGGDAMRSCVGKEWNGKELGSHATGMPTESASIFHKGEDMPDSNDWNRQTIEAFRANGGKVGGIWEGRPLLLLTTTGAKSGQSLTSPLMYLRADDPLLAFSPTGAPSPNPTCPHNPLP